MLKLYQEMYNIEGFSSIQKLNLVNDVITKYRVYTIFSLIFCKTQSGVDKLRENKFIPNQ